jgi:glycosyltransferase involved in cell wall biosynthesis
MRIVYVSDERYPSTHTDTQQVMMTLDALAGAGADVHFVIPAFSEGPHAAAQVADARDYYGTKNPFPILPIDSGNPERRALVKPTHGVRGTRMARKIGADVLYTRTLPTLLAALGRGLPTIFESYRVIDRRFPRIARVFGRIASSPNLLGVITHSGVSADGFRRCGVPDEKLQVIHNGFDAATMDPPLSKKEARALCGLPQDDCIALYTGHVNANKGMETLAELAARTPEIHHVWVGGDAGGDTSFGAQCISDAAAPNITLAGWVQPGEVGRHLYAADILLIPPAAAPLTRTGNTVLPMKTFAYMAAGRAILAPDLPDLREVLEDQRSAWLVPPDELDVAVQALQTLQGDPALADRLGAAAREDGLSMSWDRRGERVLAFITQQFNSL